MIVLDASVAVKVLVLEHDSEDARGWLRRVTDELAAPDVFAVETAQAVVRRVNSRQIDAATGRAALEAWRNILRGGMTLFRSQTTQVERAAELAMNLGHPLADCIYLALALDLDCDLVTCDARFRDKAAPSYPRILLLADLS